MTKMTREFIVLKQVLLPLDLRKSLEIEMFCHSFILSIIALLLGHYLIYNGEYSVTQQVMDNNFQN